MKRSTTGALITGSSEPEYLYTQPRDEVNRIDRLLNLSWIGSAPGSLMPGFHRVANRSGLISRLGWQIPNWWDDLWAPSGRIVVRISSTEAKRDGRMKIQASMSILTTLSYKRKDKRNNATLGSICQREGYRENRHIVVPPHAS